MIRHIGGFAFVLSLTGVASAQAAPPPEALDWMRRQIGQQIQRPPYLWSAEQLTVLLRPLFLAASADGRRITPEDREAASKAALTQARMGAMQQFLAADTAGAGRIDRTALRNATAHGQRGTEAQTTAIVERYFQDADLDRDGIVTYSEAVGAADRQNAARGLVNEAMPPALLDVDGDGVLTLDEFEGVLRQVFDEIDSDHDGRISEQEAKRFQSETLPAIQREALARAQRQRSLEATKAKASACAIPIFAADATLAVVSPEAGSALADIALGEDMRITVFNVHVEPGEKKLAVVLNAPNPALWQFTGETGRISSVFVAQHGGKATTAWKPSAGVTGIPAQKVSFASQPGCLPIPAERQDRRDELAMLLGRAPDVVVSDRAMSTARLPSGTALKDKIFPNLIDFPTDGPGAALWAMANDSGEALVHVDPDSVAAAQPVRRLSLPGIAGLARLVDEGSARIVSWQTVTRFMGPQGQIGPIIIGGRGTQITGFDGEAKVSRIPSEVLLVAQVTLPPALGRSNLRRLIVGRGVKEPSGDRSQICIIREEDGKPLEGSRCN